MNESVNTATTQNTRSDLIKNFLDSHGWDHSLRQSIVGDASFRRYERIIQEDSEKHLRMAILMDAPPDEKAINTFLEIDALLRKHGLSAPEIIAQDPQNGLLLLEDLKVDSYSLVLSGASLFNSDYLVEQRLYRAAVDALLHMQRTVEAKDVLPDYNDDLLLREVILFPEWYLPYKGVQLTLEQKRAYTQIWQEIFPEIDYKYECFVHRDYHADNLIWLPTREGIERVGILDFQDAVYGCPAYDLLSLLEDARRDVSSATVLAMYDYYLEMRPDLDPEKFKKTYAILAAQRNIKIIGIFARLATRDKKYKYLSMLPRVWSHLEHDLAMHPVLDNLKQWLDSIIEDRSEDVRMHKMAHLATSMQQNPVDQE